MASNEFRQFLKFVFVSASNYVVIAVLFALYFVIDHFVEPFHQHFSLRNYTIQYPHAEHERLTLRQTGYIAFLAPALIIFIYSIFIEGFIKGRSVSRHALFQLNDRTSQQQVRAQVWELNCGWLGLGLAEGLAFLATTILKRLAGKPRPDLIARCFPKPGSVDPKPFGLSDISICTQTDRHKLQDGFMSFPSGHSSTAFAGLTFLSLYLYHKLHSSSTASRQNWRIVIAIVPLLAAALVVVTRIMDARHHPFDVLSGSALGIATAILSWNHYFPISTSDERSADGGLYLPVHEDEAGLRRVE